MNRATKERGIVYVGVCLLLLVVVVMMGGCSPMVVPLVGSGASGGLGVDPVVAVSVWQWLLEGVGTFIGGVIDEVLGAFQWLWDKAVVVVQDVGDWAGQLVEDIWAWLGGAFDAVIATIKGMGEGAAEWIMGLAGDHGLEMDIQGGRDAWDDVMDIFYALDWILPVTECAIIMALGFGAVTVIRIVRLVIWIAPWIG